MYAMLKIRPDIAYIILKYNKYMAKLNNFCIKVIKWIFKYLRITVKYELVYYDNLFILKSFINVN